MYALTVSTKTGKKKEEEPVKSLPFSQILKCSCNMSFERQGAAKTFI